MHIFDVTQNRPKKIYIEKYDENYRSKSRSSGKRNGGVNNHRMHKYRMIDEMNGSLECLNILSIVLEPCLWCRVDMINRTELLFLANALLSYSVLKQMNVFAFISHCIYVLQWTINTLAMHSISNDTRHLNANKQICCELGENDSVCEYMPFIQMIYNFS